MHYTLLRHDAESRTPRPQVSVQESEAEKLDWGITEYKFILYKLEQSNINNESFSIKENKALLRTFHCDLTFTTAAIRKPFSTPNVLCLLYWDLAWLVLGLVLILGFTQRLKAVDVM